MDACSCEYVCVHPHICGSQGLVLGVFSLKHPPYFLRQYVQRVSRSLSWPVSPGTLAFASPVLGLQVCMPNLPFYVGGGN